MVFARKDGDFDGLCVSFREGKQQEFHASWFQTISGSERFRNPTVSELYRPCESRTHLAVAIPVPAMYGININQM